MFIVHVSIHVKPDCIEPFKAATLENVKNSIREPGIARFDFLAQEEPCRFLLIEAYRTPEDALRHKETPHYHTWRNAVEHMMAEPRSSIKYSNIAPDDTGWET
jgi:quinol monooxygenase YgiN